MCVCVCMHVQLHASSVCVCTQHVGLCVAEVVDLCLLGMASKTIQHAVQQTSVVMR